MTLDNFLDIIKHTSGLGFIEMVKLTGTTDGVSLEAMDNDRTVVINAMLKNPIDGLADTKTIGLSRLGVLAGYLNFSPFSASTATSEIKTQKRGTDDVPAEIKFDSGSGHVAHYRFMSAELADEMIKVPPFKGATWQVVITPTKNAMKDLSAMNAILGAFEPTFTVRTTDTNLEFLIGSGTSDRSTIVFAKDIVGELKHQWSWPLAQVLAILKLHESSASCTMSFSDQGALQIEIDSGLGVYKYILPARN